MVLRGGAKGIKWLSNQVPNAYVLSFLLLSLLHLISYRLKIVFSPRYTRLAPFLPWVTKLVSPDLNTTAVAALSLSAHR